MSRPWLPLHQHSCHIQWSSIQLLLQQQTLWLLLRLKLHRRKVHSHTSALTPAWPCGNGYLLQSWTQPTTQSSGHPMPRPRTFANTSSDRCFVVLLHLYSWANVTVALVHASTFRRPNLSTLYTFKTYFSRSLNLHWFWLLATKCDRLFCLYPKSSVCSDFRLV